MYTPAAPTTSTCKRQDPAEPVPLLARAGIVAPFIVIDDDPAAAVITPPAHVVAALGGVAILSCPVPEFAAGSVSFKLADVIGFTALLYNTKDIVETLFSARGPAGVNDLSMLTVLELMLDVVVCDGAPLHVPPAL